MRCFPIKTHKIKYKKDNDILNIIDLYIKNLKENSVVCITSKIISICEGRVKKDCNFDELIKKESDLYIPSSKNKYKTTITVKEGTLIARSGVDNSNSDGYYVLWPKNPFKSANQICEFLKKKFKIKNLGVIISDSRSIFLRKGTCGICIGYCGLKPFKKYKNATDIFNFTLNQSLNIVDNLATVGVLVMGEGSEQTPIAIIENAEHIKFTNLKPSTQEISLWRIKKEDDLYHYFFENAKWEKGN